MCICLAPQACPLLGGVCVHLSWLPCLPSASQAGVHLSRLLSPALCFAGLVCTLILAPQDCPLCHRAGVHVFFSHQSALLAVGLTCSSFSSQAHPLCTAQVCMPPLSVCIRAHLLCCEGCVHFRDLYAHSHLAGQVCPLCHKCHVSWRSLQGSQFPECAVWSRPQILSC